MAYPGLGIYVGAGHAEGEVGVGNLEFLPLVQLVTVQRYASLGQSKLMCQSD